MNHSRYFPLAITALVTKAPVVTALAVIALVAFATAGAARADGESSPEAESEVLNARQIERARQLIGRLDGDSVIAVRSALESLQAYGEPVLGELNQALAKSENPKAQGRLRKIIEAIEIEAIDKNAVHLDAILDQVRKANRKNLNKEHLEALLDQLIIALQIAKEDDTLKLPVRFSDVKKNGKRGNGHNQLIIEPNVDIRMVHNSIVLADSVAKIGMAQNSIIIARVATKISSARNCVIITGLVSEMTHIDKCVALAGVSVHVSRASGSMIGATEPVKISMGNNGTVLINATPDQRAGRHGDVKGVIARGLVLRDKKIENPLKDTLTLTHASALDGGLALFRLKDGSGEYVARTDKEILRADGTPLAELAGWKLSYTGKGFVIFGDGDRYCYMSYKQ